MKRRFILLAAGITCCLFASACAGFPKHVSAKLMGPQARNPYVTPGTDSAGMIVWNKPELNNPLPPSTLATKSIERCGGIAGKLFAEWQNVDGKQLQAVHGTAAASEFSGYDFWGTHRYHDWNILLVVNQGHEVREEASCIAFIVRGTD